jgi:hypothetical protein
MTHFEDELKNALGRQEAPRGFADRVLARAAEQASQPTKAAWRDSWRDSWRKIFAQPLVSGMLLRWAATAAVCTALVLGGAHYRNVQRERARGEAAKERLLLALRIAGSKLQLAKTRVDQINSDQSNADQTENQQERE